MDPDAVKRAHTDHPVHQFVVQRWSPYAFSDEPVSEKDLHALFEAVRWAPSSYNEQPWSYIVARKDDTPAFERLLSCLVDANQAWAKHAPVLALGVVTKTFERNGKPNKAAEHDLGLAAGNLLLEASARNLYVHQMIGILPDRARELYAIPPEADALTGIAIGHRGSPSRLPDELAERDLSARERKPLRAFVFGGRFGQPAGGF